LGDAFLKGALPHSAEVQKTLHGLLIAVVVHALGLMR
jgi:hypothetical protein